MQICIFNPEHDLCLASGRALYIPPRSAVQFAQRDAHLMKVLYPDAHCTSVYDLNAPVAHKAGQVVAWGWNAVVKHQLLRRGVSESLLPSDEEIDTIRELQHRTTVLPLQTDCRALYTIEEAGALFAERPHWVLKAPWSGAGRGLRWLHSTLSDIDRNWIEKTVRNQRCVIAEPRREVVADLALEYLDGTFMGYSLFRTGSGVYKENILWPDRRIEAEYPAVLAARERIEPWLNENILTRYNGPLGVDLMLCADGSLHVAELNLRHTMGMISHAKIPQS